MINFSIFTNDFAVFWRRGGVATIDINLLFVYV